MWRKEDGNPQPSPEASSSPMNPNTVGRSAPSSLGPSSPSSKAVACVSQGIKIKGEVTGNEDLFVDGIVEGKISIPNSAVTVGPNSTVKADITAREIVVRGRAEGKFTASERIQFWHTARVEGDVKSERIGIEEGAVLHGKVEAGHTTAKAPAGDAAGPSKKTKESTSGEGKATTDAALAGAD